MGFSCSFVLFYLISSALPLYLEIEHGCMCMRLGRGGDGGEWGVVPDRRRPWLFRSSVADDCYRLSNQDSWARGACGYLPPLRKCLVLNKLCKPV